MNNLVSTIPKKNIDFGKNYIEVLDNVFTGHKTTLRVDKLSFTSEPKNRENLTGSLKSIKSTSKYKVEHYESTGDISKLYTRTIEISSKKNRNIGLIIHYKPKVKNINFIRFELSPQHIKPKKMAYLINFLAKPVHLGDEIFNLLKIAKVTRIDIALDIYGISCFDYYFGLDKATKGKLYPKETNNGFGGVRLGSYLSNLHITAYDKVFIKKSTLTLDVVSNEIFRFMRIEARIKPKSQDAPLLSDLFFVENFPNPFERLSIYPLSIKEQLFKHRYFCDLLDKMTIPEALCHLEKGYGKDCIRKILQQNKVCVFDSKLLWEREKMLCMQLISPLQQPAYWDRVQWSKFISKLRC